MPNDTKPAGLACQKCRTPIDIDASIDQLNPAAFKLLTGTTTPGFFLGPVLILIAV